MSETGERQRAVWNEVAKTQEKLSGRRECVRCRARLRHQP